jgi:hypothetical protein
MRYLLLALAMFGAVPTLGPVTFSVKIKVEDSSGAVVKDELVIIQDLNGREHEILRVLSDEYGIVPVLQLPPGLYRFIATNPYGEWQTKVLEFLVGQQSTEVTIRVEAMPTHGYGDIVTIDTTRVQLQVIGPDEKPASGAIILIRDRNATLYLERWYKTDSNGVAKVELIGKPTVAVVVYGDILLTKELAQHDLKPVIRLRKR